MCEPSPEPLSPRVLTLEETADRLIEAERQLMQQQDSIMTLEAQLGERNRQLNDAQAVIEALQARISVKQEQHELPTEADSNIDTRREGALNAPTDGPLQASLKGTEGMRAADRRTDTAWADIRPVQELQETESAVTCLSFGQERHHRGYVLLATGAKDGSVTVYRCYRTEMELSILKDVPFRTNEAQPVPQEHSNIAIHSRMTGHQRAVTSLFFNLLEDQVVTTSIDKSVRFWNVDTGEMLKVFPDSSPALVAAFLPFNPSVFVAANANAVLRLVNVQNGLVVQKLKVESEVRALKFDDTGLFCLAGTKNGAIHVLETSDSNTLKFKFKYHLSRGAVTWITFVGSNSPDSNPCLLVNSCDSHITIIDCIYGPPQGVLTNLFVRQRVKVAHSLLPLRNCFSVYGGGFLISASEDRDIYICSLAKSANYKMHYLKHHNAPVLAVAVNALDTLIASADSIGNIVLWRRLDFSHTGEGRRDVAGW